MQHHEDTTDPLSPQTKHRKISDELESPSGDAVKVSLLDLLLILLRRKWFLIGGTFIIGVAAVIYSLTATSYYTSTTLILPSKNDLSSPLGSLAGDLPISGLLKSFDFLGGEDNSRFLSILESRRLSDKVIEKFNLVHRYEFDEKKRYYHEDVLKRFHKNVLIEEDDLDNISIAVTDSSPVVAAEMANYIVYLLDSITYQINRENARGSRLFFETRLNQLRETLDSVHHAFADFQNKYNFVDMEQQVKATIDALATVQAEAMAAEVEADILAMSFGSNQKMAEARKKKAAIDKRLEQYLREGSGMLILPLKKTPELGIQYSYLYRDVKVQETLYAFMLQLYEQAKFREANNSPVVTVLEDANIPQKRTRPKRSVLCLLSVTIGFSVLSLLVLIEYWFGKQRQIDSDSYRKLVRVRQHFRFRK